MSKRQSESRRPPLGAIVALALLAVLHGCATSPLGRSQLRLYSESDMDSMGAAAFTEMRRETPASRSTELNRYVDCVANAVTGAMERRDISWEVVVFDDDQANAFALPGGKIGVYRGLLDVAENASQLATVIGHEVGHVIAQHANERVSTSALADVGMQVASTISGAPSVQKNRALAALGLGVQVGVLLPFGRTQEAEADLIGLDLMASAGFDPRESVTLWQNMSRNGGGPPEFLSTHPASDTRIKGLQGRMASAMELYSQARAAGRRPDCDRLRP